ncbi:peroxide stress protein YaaA [Kangiella sp. HZ709]|uniref:peroxide stress protein YaaA n=1 Tax=Kangiella sp. HZ709 TaxID=2666328 RepID=UPI0012B0F638|nr:peroxide stress protein YaaA [Kangiella sp. HZ709]MRX26978.1 peroxide stress protein YaaA [Kangiella sp. HZ709]
MLTVVSPAKTLDFETKSKSSISTSPDFLDDSQELINQLKKFKSQDVIDLMGVSQKIADLNVERFQSWKKPFTADNAKQAVLAFKGDVYTGLDAETMKANDFKFAQKHLRILSGLYGLLRPMDLMQPYRLEMGKKLANKRGSNLYQFWGEQITDALNEQLKSLKSEVLINLASNEYFKSVKPKILNADVITPAFKEYKNGDYKMISFYAKKARGLLSRYIIDNRITAPEDIKSFNLEGYKFSKKLSKDNTWTFTRKQ